MPLASEAARNTRSMVVARDSYQCVCCGASISGKLYSVLPRVPLTQGGSYRPENLVTVLGNRNEGCCRRIYLHDDPRDEIKGYRLPATTDGKPTDLAQVPVMVVISPQGPGAALWLRPDGTRTTEMPEAVPGPR